MKHGMFDLMEIGSFLNIYKTFSVKHEVDIVVKEYDETYPIYG